MSGAREAGNTVGDGGAGGLHGMACRGEVEKTNERTMRNITKEAKPPCKAVARPVENYIEEEGLFCLGSHQLHLAHHLTCKLGWEWLE